MRNGSFASVFLHHLEPIRLPFYGVHINANLAGRKREKENGECKLKGAASALQTPVIELNKLELPVSKERVCAH